MPSRRAVGPPEPSMPPARSPPSGTLPPERDDAGMLPLQAPGRELRSVRTYQPQSHRKAVLIIRIVFAEGRSVPESGRSTLGNGPDPLITRLNLLGRKGPSPHPTLNEFCARCFQYPLDLIERARRHLAQPVRRLQPPHTVTTETWALHANSSWSIRSRARAARI